MVEELARQRAGPLAVRGFGHRDAGRRLHDAVEPPPAAPRPSAAPRRQAHHDQAGMPLRQGLRVQPELVQRVRPVSVHQDVGAGEQVVQPSAAAGGAEVEQCAALAEQPVVGVQRQLRPVRRIQPEHVRAERAEVPCRHRAGDDAGEVEHPDARGGQRPGRAPARRRAADRRRFHQRRRGDHLARRFRPPAGLVADGGRDPARAGYQVLGLPGAQFRDRRRHRLRVAVRVASAAQRAQQRRAVPGVVAVRAHPAVGGPPEP